MRTGDGAGGSALATAYVAGGAGGRLTRGLRTGIFAYWWQAGGSVLACVYVAGGGSEGGGGGDEA